MAQISKMPGVPPNAEFYEMVFEIADPDPDFKVGMTANVTFIMAWPPRPWVAAEISFIEMPDLAPVDLAKLDLASIERKPGVDILSAPSITARSGQECEVVTVRSYATDALATTPTGVRARLRPTLDGETVHYALKLSVSIRRNPNDAGRSTTQEFTHRGDARLDQPVIVDIGEGDKGRRLLARMVFHRGKEIPTNGAVLAKPLAPKPSSPPTHATFATPVGEAAH